MVEEEVQGELVEGLGKGGVWWGEGRGEEEVAKGGEEGGVRGGLEKGEGEVVGEVVWLEIGS